MSSLDEFAKTKLAALEAAHLKRTLADTMREDGIWVTRDGRRMLSFSCNDYLNLTHHPAVKRAAIEAVEKWGAGAGASRLVTGNHPLLGELERRLAQFKGTEAACVFGSGYLANAGIVPALMGEGDLVLVDALSHSCLWAGARLSRCSCRAISVTMTSDTPPRFCECDSRRISPRDDRDRWRVLDGWRSGAAETN